jgi:hypothetical protein
MVASQPFTTPRLGHLLDRAILPQRAAEANRSSNDACFLMVLLMLAVETESVTRNLSRTLLSFASGVAFLRSGHDVR